MDKHRIRNLIPLVFAPLILAGFLISTSVGVWAVIFGGALSGMLWATLSGPPAGTTGPRADRVAARTARRSGRR